ncbi:MAG: hypothetical protein LBL07_18950 [Tannerella sp.]|nr:hypothetical protein [Tannerella sp.]
MTFSGLRAEVIILTSDQQLYDLMDPDKKIDMSLGYTPSMRSLRDVCESGKKHGHKELTVAFDEFFRQYRPQAGTERRLTPDMDEYVGMIKYISDFAKKYGMSICLSLLSPLELGPAYKNRTGEAGRWLGYKVGVRNPSDGKFSLSIWQQLFWTNNKGKFRINLKSVRAYAFREKPLGSSHYIAVSPDDIIEIRDIKYEAGDTIDVNGEGGGILNSPDDMIYPVRDLRVYYDGPKQLEGYDRVMVLVEYETPEVDYFSPKAPDFLKELMDQYKRKDVNLTSFYSDEMHIQQDWIYFSHHEGGQFATRYLSPGFSDSYRKKYGQPLDDKYMLYFVYGAPWYRATADAVRNVQYVMGDTPEAIHRTFLLRDRYYRMLNRGVVDLFKEAKDYAEKLFKREMPTGAHASWAESPTIDLWDYEKLHTNAYRYEYTSNFVWSNTVHQASAACYDYFKWGEYLQPTGNDFAECGWADRDYYGAAMGASIGVVNKYPDAYAAAWGFPAEALAWKNTLNEAYGAQPSRPMRLMTGNVHRDIEVLMLYPMNLVAVEERFGSWMTQYGYANYLTADKLLELGTVLPDGRMQVGEKKYGTLVALFEPLPDKGLLDMMEQFVEKGGTVIWFSAPPLIDGEGRDCSGQWQSLFGVRYVHDEYMGEMAPAKKISFENSFSAIPEQVILTDFLVDRIYPVTKESPDIEVVATVEDRILGTRRKKGKGTACYFGFRPRDDQSASLGYETRTLFEILHAANAYPSSGRFAVNDNPACVSRTTDFLATAFPNGTTAIVKHYRTHRENWEGGFSRNEEADARSLAANPLPSDKLELRGLKVNGHEVSYTGKRNMAFRTGDGGRLIAFNGRACTGITVDGRQYDFSATPVDLIYSPVDGNPKACQLQVTGSGRISIPLPETAKSVTVKDGKKTVAHTLSEGTLTVEINGDLSGKWLDLTFK